MGYIWPDCSHARKVQKRNTIDKTTAIHNALLGVPTLGVDAVLVQQALEQGLQLMKANGVMMRDQSGECHVFHTLLTGFGRISS